MGVLGARGAGAGTPSARSDAEALHRNWDFGDLPESVEVNRNRLRLVVYPAVEDRGAGVAVIEARNPATAESVSRRGMVRLAVLALPQQAKTVGKRFADDRELVLLSRGLPLAQTLADALTQRTFLETLFAGEPTLPRNHAQFAKLLDAHRGDLIEVADRLAVAVSALLKEWRAVRAAADGAKSPSFAEALADINGQLATLLPANFIEATPRQWLDYLPRYLKAIGRRLERLPGNLKRDAELAAKVKPFAAAFRTLAAQPTASAVRPELEQLRWMIEEFRVSLFAQELKTMLKVSEKRLAEQLELAKVEAAG